MHSQYTVEKTFTWEMAHRLVDGYVGKCTSLHGHSWEATIVVGGYHETTEKGYIGQAGLDKFGMLVDFNDFKAMKAWIDEYWDHGTMLNANDPLLTLLSKVPECKTIPVIGNPTSENLARMIAMEAGRVILAKYNGQQLGRMWIARVEVKETCTSKAVFYRD